MQPRDFLEPVKELAQAAGAAILQVYGGDFHVSHKDDDSPLTKADLASNRIIVAGLRALAPDLPLISEEIALPPYAERSQWPRYWLIDPLDGTREFVSRNGEFTVNIALIDQRRPVLGVVYAPVTGFTYAAAEGLGAMRQSGDGAPVPISVASRAAVPPRVIGSRSHRGASLDAYLAKLGEHEFLPMGSSLKFCRIAEGAADLYPRLGPTSEWDTAAAQAVVEQAGGQVLSPDGKPLLYNTKEDILNGHFFVIGPRDRNWLQTAGNGHCEAR
ncbi:MAG: 3'(2'),5'-bisphosphate nucleotidase CysQ [Halioglobus sp.]|nr:3'(2'),5'-bisphosphate nucleotidase CysQ [Halioglobus sp.]